MLYQSTRNNQEQISASSAILRGIAPDGGLYMLNSFEGLGFEWEKTLSMTTLEIAEYVLSTL